MAGSPSGRRALVVESDPALADFYVRALEWAGIAAKAVRHLPETPQWTEEFHLVVMDPFPSDESDPAPLRALRVRGCSLPVLGITNLASRDPVTLSSKLDPVIVLGKPFDLSELRSALLELGFHDLESPGETGR
jgi:DNA-binding response OmpR family regulator